MAARFLGFSSFLRPSRHYQLLVDELETAKYTQEANPPAEHPLSSIPEQFCSLSERPVLVPTAATA